MSKEKKNNVPKSTMDIAKVITNSLNKKGKIKGKDEDETKKLKSMCVHHRITKKGKLKCEAHNEGNGYMYCPMCGQRIPTELKNKEQRNEIVDPVIELVNQLKFKSVAAGLGDESVKYSVGLAVELGKLKKTDKKANKIIAKRDNVKKMKKKNKNRGEGSEFYGGWR